MCSKSGISPIGPPTCITYKMHKTTMLMNSSAVLLKFIDNNCTSLFFLDKSECNVGQCGEYDTVHGNTDPVVEQPVGIKPTDFQQCRPFPHDLKPSPITFAMARKRKWTTCGSYHLTYTTSEKTSPSISFTERA